MRMQRISPSCSGRNDDTVAAMQHKFPEAVVQNCLTCLNINRPFAAPVSDVSHADEAELDDARVNDRSARKGVMLFCRVAFKGAISALDLQPYAKWNFIALASR